jgi:plastocyanin
MKGSKSYIARETITIMSNRSTGTAAKMILVLSGLTFVCMTLPVTLAQGTNDTDVTNASNGEVNQSIEVVIPRGSSSSVGGLGFEPVFIAVSPGATVVWDNQDNGTHTATSGNPETETPDEKFDTGTIGPDQKSIPVTMPTQPGSYNYFCTLHPHHFATVIVE